MAEVEQVARGIVRRVMPYGAIVQLEDGVTGLVHISEIDNCYVSDVSQYCTEGAPVVVQVLRRKEDGRWEFSMKKARKHPLARELAAELAVANAYDESAPADDFGAGAPMYDAAVPHQPPSRPSISPQKRAEFDEKLRDFLSDSSDQIDDMRRHHENRLGGKRR